MIRAKMSVQGQAQIDVEVRCEGCQLEYKDSKTVPITFDYNSSSRRLEPKFEERIRIGESALPEGWTPRSRSQMFSGEGHYTEWTDYYCPNCSIEQKVN